MACFCTCLGSESGFLSLYTDLDPNFIIQYKSGSASLLKTNVSDPFGVCFLRIRIQLFSHRVTGAGVFDFLVAMVGADFFSVSRNNNNELGVSICVIHLTLSD